MKRKLVTVDAETLLSTPMSKTMFIVDGLIPQALRWHKFQADIEAVFLRPGENNLKWQ